MQCIEYQFDIRFKRAENIIVDHKIHVRLKKWHQCPLNKP